MSGEGVQFTAVARVSPSNPDTVLLTLVATNRSDGYRTAYLAEPGKCGPSIAFATGRGKATRVWRRVWPTPQLPPGIVEVCSAVAAFVRFPPGASVDTFRAALAVRSILGDSLPPGLYRGVIGANAELKGGIVTPEIELR